MAEPGWYTDPGDPQSLRYFDGAQWTEHRQPATVATQQGTPVDQPNAGYGQPVSTETEHLPSTPAAASGASPYGPGVYGASQYGADPYGPAQAQSPQSEPTQEGGPAQYGTAQYGPAQYGTAQYGAGQYPGPGYGPAVGSGGYPTAAGAGPYPGPQPGYGQPVAGPSAKKSKRLPLIVAVVVVAALVAGGLVYLLIRPAKPKLTFQGKKIANAGAVLSDAQNDMQTLVKSRHGAAADDARCYYAVPKTTSSGAKKTDVDTQLRCGPVLFVDGDTSRPYLRYLISGQQDGGSIKLSVASTPSSSDPQSVGDVDLKRPDGKAAPDGSGGLKPPAPPAAAANAIAAAVLGPAKAPTTLATPVSMQSRTTGVQVLAAGVVSRYGTGDDARTAPKGDRLIAMQLNAVSGVYDDNDPFASLKFDDGTGAARAVPEPQSQQWVVAVAPQSGTPKLILTADGATQYITLPDAKAGPSNIAVLNRTNTKFSTAKSVNVTRQVTGGGSSPFSQVLNVSFVSAQLRYWPSATITKTPSSPANAFLVIDMDYNYTGSSGGPFGFDPALLKLQITGGATVAATNVDSGNYILDVFQVPATFTSGSIVISGTTKLGAYTVTIPDAAKIPVSIQAG